jgi:hypothetical protein
MDWKEETDHREIHEDQVVSLFERPIASLEPVVADVDRLVTEALEDLASDDRVDLMEERAETGGSAYGAPVEWKACKGRRERIDGDTDLVVIDNEDAKRCRRAESRVDALARDGLDHVLLLPIRLALRTRPDDVIEIRPLDRPRQERRCR